MKPSVGRIVHYISADRYQHCAAIITRVRSNSETCVDLIAFVGGEDQDQYLSFQKDVNLDETATGIYSWHWPERTE